MNDLEEVMDIEPVAFGSHHWSYQSFVNELSNSMGHYFAACDPDSERLVGYSGFWLIGEEAHITTLAVHPDYRRQRIGEKLLINDIVEARRVGARWITLEVRLSNETAQQLYYKYGFKNLGMRRNYYQDNDEDALVLWTENIFSSDFNELVKRRVAELAALGQLGSRSPEEVFPEPALESGSNPQAKPENKDGSNGREAPQTNKQKANQNGNGSQTKTAAPAAKTPSRRAPRVETALEKTVTNAAKASGKQDQINSDQH